VAALESPLEPAVDLCPHALERDAAARRDDGRDQWRSLPSQVLRDASLDVALGEAEVVACDAVTGHRQAAVEVQQVLGRRRCYAEVHMRDQLARAIARTWSA
jgi:hypothetical protein